MQSTLLVGGALQIHISDVGFNPKSVPREEFLSLKVTFEASEIDSFSFDPSRLRVTMTDGRSMPVSVFRIAVAAGATDTWIVTSTQLSNVIQLSPGERFFVPYTWLSDGPKSSICISREYIFAVPTMMCRGSRFEGNRNTVASSNCIKYPTCGLTARCSPTPSARYAAHAARQNANVRLHMAGADLSNLQTYQTPKERLRSALWALLAVVVSCALSWDLSVYSINFWESGRASGLIVPALLAVALIHTIRLSIRARQHWWPLLPAIVPQLLCR